MRIRALPSQLSLVTVVTFFVLVALGIITRAPGVEASGVQSRPAPPPAVAAVPAGAARSQQAGQPAGGPLAPSVPLCAPDWVVVTSPNVGTGSNYLQAVAAVSSSDAWAAGFYYNGTASQTLLEHWNGSSWNTAPSPNPGTTDNTLSGLAAISGINVWGVGSYRDGATNQTLVEHWNGTSWSVVASPNVGTSDNILSGVAAVSGTDVWAAGTYRTATGFQTLVEHWNGTSWSVVSSPSIAPGTSDLAGVTALSTNNVWAVGSYNTSVFRTLVEHWDGTTWSVVPSPNVGAGINRLYSVAALSAGDIWAVGSYSVSTANETLVEHWDGSSWSVVTSPNPSASNNSFSGVTAVSANDVWAVGSYSSSTASQSLVEHWDGSSWNVVSSPNAGTSANTLVAVAAVSISDVWAVGNFNTGTVASTLVERYNPCAVPLPTSCPLQFSDVPQGSTFYAYVRCLACRGAISGYADGTFRPNNNLTRGQLAKIVSNAGGYSDRQPTQLFEDVSLGSTFQVFIGRIATRGYIGGYPCGGPGEPCNPPANLPYFRPNSNATRGQISKIVANAAVYSDPPAGQQFEDVPPGSTYYTYTYRLATRGVMGGYPCGGPGEPCNPPGNLPYFRPNNNATRGQTSKIVSNTFFPGCVTPLR